MALLLLEVSAVFFVLVAAVGAIHARWPRESGDRMVLAGIAVAVLALALAIGGRTVEIGAFPMANMHDALALFGFLLALIGGGIAWKRGVPQAAPLTAALVSVLLIIAVAIEPRTTVPEALRSHWLPVHIAFAFLGDAAFAIAGVVSLVYLVHERSLKSKRKKDLVKVGTGQHKMPALEVLDRTVVQLIQWGFPLMTMGLLTGAIYGNQVWGTYWRWEPRNVVSALVWVLYAALLHARLTIGWRGRKLALLTLVGVVLTLAAFIGLGLAGVGVHGKEYVS